MPTDFPEPSDPDGRPAVVMTPEAISRHNLKVESLFSAFNGVFMGMILSAGAGLFIALNCLQASVIEITIIASAFPCGAFMGPIWAWMGRRMGMKRLVILLGITANVPLFFIYWIEGSTWFTAILTFSGLLHCAMRLGMSSLYRVNYPRAQTGRVVGWLTLWTYATMLGTVLIAGWLTDERNDPMSYRYLYPISAVCGLLACCFYARLKPIESPEFVKRNDSFRTRLRGVKRVVVGDRGYMLFQLSFFLSGSAFFMSIHTVVLMCTDGLGFGAWECAVWLSALPQALLLISSPIWGVVLDRLGIVRARTLVSLVMTAYLSSYFFGIMFGILALVYLGSIMRGLSEGGGHVTWSLASVHFAPRSDDVPLYLGIHFVLNGIRGLVMPAMGSMLMIASGPWTLIVALAAAAGSAVVARTNPKALAESEPEAPVAEDSIRGLAMKPEVEAV